MYLFSFSLTGSQLAMRTENSRRTEAQSPQSLKQEPKLPWTSQGPTPPASTEGIVPEVVGAFSLPKATARHDTDAGLLQELHAVKHIWGHLMGLWEEDRT